MNAHLAVEVFNSEYPTNCFDCRMPLDSRTDLDSMVLHSFSHVWTSPHQYLFQIFGQSLFSAVLHHMVWKNKLDYRKIENSIRIPNRGSRCWSKLLYPDRGLKGDIFIAAIPQMNNIGN
ncbi:MAG: hypothetical protein ACI9FD_002418 [Gammaproteobacteria bacterium]